MIVQTAHTLSFKLNYLRYDFESGFCYVILGNTFLDRQNRWGDLTKMDITFEFFLMLTLGLLGVSVSRCLGAYVSRC